MVKHWQPGTDYERGDVVKYHGTHRALRRHLLRLNLIIRPQIQGDPKAWIFGTN
jgi:hypothetical protein